VFVPSNRLRFGDVTVPMVKSRGAVSPAARATARRAPLTTPGRAAGRITVKIVREGLEPSAALASRNSFGTNCRAVSADLITMGSIRQPSASAPAKPMYPNRSTQMV